MKTIGVIGLGSIGMRHAKNLIAMGNDVIGHDPAITAESFLKDPFSIPTGLLCTSIDKVISRSDAIIISSPTKEHYAHLVEIIKLNKPVFVEKPIADTPSVGLLRDHIRSIPFMVGYNLRFHPCVTMAKEYLRKDVIGKPLCANFTCGQFSSKSAYLRDGVILNWSHEIDLALHLLGPARVQGSMVSINNGSDDAADILLLHYKSTGSVVHLDYLTSPEQRHFTITGTLGVMKADLLSRKLTIEKPDGSRSEDHFSESSFDLDYIAEMKAFLDRIDGKETLGCTGEEALRVLEICLKVREQAGL